MVLIFFIAVIAIIIALIIDAGGIELLLLIIGLIIVFIALMIALAIYCSNAENEESKPRFAARPISAELERIDNMNGLEFENYTARLLRQLGYTNVEVIAISKTRPSPSQMQVKTQRTPKANSKMQKTRP